MIYYICALFIGGIIGFYIGLTAGIYCYMKDNGLLPSQRSSYQSPKMDKGGDEAGFTHPDCFYTTSSASRSPAFPPTRGEQ
jgi:hypothetical protein